MYQTKSRFHKLCHHFIIATMVKASSTVATCIATTLLLLSLCGLATAQAGRVVGLRLIRGGTTKVVTNLANGTIVRVPTGETPSFSVEAVTTGSPVTTVQFGYNGNVNFKTETSAPWTLCGDSVKSIPACPVLTFGSHTVSARINDNFATTYQVTFQIVSASAPVPAPVAPPKAAAPKAASPTKAPLSTPKAAPPTKAPLAPPKAAPPTKAPLAPPKATPPTKAPLSSPKAAPPTNAPIAPPKAAPPTKAPLTPPTKAPLSPPTEAPLSPPTRAPLSPPTQAPVSPPKVAPPTNAPLSPPKAAPPTEVPLSSPTKSPGAVLNATNAPTAPPLSNITFAPIRINCGSDRAYNDSLGREWSADAYFTGGSSFASGIGQILNTTDDVIYRSERYGDATYNIPVPPGTYDVVLHFAEILYVSSRLCGFSRLP
jgi:Malectin domain